MWRVGGWCCCGDSGIFRRIGLFLCMIVFVSLLSFSVFRISWVLCLRRRRIGFSVRILFLLVFGSGRFFVSCCSL